MRLIKVLILTASITMSAIKIASGSTVWDTLRCDVKVEVWDKTRYRDIKALKGARYIYLGNDISKKVTVRVYTVEGIKTGYTYYKDYMCR